MARFLWLLLFAVIIGPQQGEWDESPGFTPEQLQEYKKQQYTQRIVETYRVDKRFALDVVNLAFKYGNDRQYPRPADILSIISIESNFRPHVKSKLRRDKAEGLTQIRPKVWRHLIPSGALTSIENQVKYGSMILTQYYQILGNEKEATNAYNVGLTNHRRGIWNPRYESRFAVAKQLFM